MKFGESARKAIRAVNIRAFDVLGVATDFRRFQPRTANLDWGSGGRWFESSHPDQFFAVYSGHMGDFDSGT